MYWLQKTGQRIIIDTVVEPLKSVLICMLYLNHLWVIHRNIMTATKNKISQTFYTHHNLLTSHSHIQKSYSANYFYSHWALLNGLIYNAVEEPCCSFLLKATFNFFSDWSIDWSPKIHCTYNIHHIFSPLAISIRNRKSTFFVSTETWREYLWNDRIIRSANSRQLMSCITDCRRRHSFSWLQLLLLLLLQFVTRQIHTNDELFQHNTVRIRTNKTAQFDTHNKTQ